jgi:putative FmdB family regulatory protein
MPLYEYVCDACGHRFELIRKFSDPPLDKCPVCGGAVHKLQSAPAIQFKGSGFYITDYAKKEHVAAAKADHESPAASETKDAKDSGGKSAQEKKTETKAETKTETTTGTKSAAKAGTPSATATTKST